MIKSIRYIKVFYLNLRKETNMKKIEFYNNKNIISERLKAARKQLNLSQAELAARLQVYNINIDQQMISKIEKNLRQVTDYELACICICLKTTPEWMLSDFDKYIDME